MEPVNPPTADEVAAELAETEAVPLADEVAALRARVAALEARMDDHTVPSEVAGQDNAPRFRMSEGARTDLSAAAKATKIRIT